VLQKQRKREGGRDNVRGRNILQTRKKRWKFQFCKLYDYVLERKTGCLEIRALKRGFCFEYICMLFFF